MSCYFLGILNLAIKNPGIHLLEIYWILEVDGKM